MRVEFGSEDVGAPQATRLTRQDKRPDHTVAVADADGKVGESAANEIADQTRISYDVVGQDHQLFVPRAHDVGVAIPARATRADPAGDQCALDGVRERTDTVNPDRRGASAGSVGETGIGELLEQLLRHGCGNPEPRRFPEDVCAGSRAVHFAQDRLHRAIVDPDRQSQQDGTSGGPSQLQSTIRARQNSDPRVPSRSRGSL